MGNSRFLQRKLGVLVWISEGDYILGMAFLFLFFTTVLTLCVVGLIVLALASILGSVRDDWKLKKPKQAKPRPGDY
jgi:hypothetical protein